MCSILNCKDLEYTKIYMSSITYNSIINNIIYKINTFEKKRFYKMYYEKINNTYEINIKLILLINLNVVKINITIQNIFEYTRVIIKKNWGDINDYKKVVNYLFEDENEIKKILQINTQKKILATNLIHNINYGNYMEKILNAKSLALYYINKGYILEQNLSDIIRLLKNDIFLVQGYVTISLVHIFNNNKHIHINKNINMLRKFKNNLEKIKMSGIKEVNNNTINDLIITFYMSNMASELLNLIK